MLREKRPCVVCDDDTTSNLRDCGGCKKSLCRYCAREHVCGEDGRSELVKLLGDHIEDCEDAGGLVMARFGGLIVAYLPKRKTVSRQGLQVLIEHERQRAKQFEALPKKISESLCCAPLSARGALCFASNGGFSSLFAAKKADSEDVLTQFRALLEAERLVNF